MITDATLLPGAVPKAARERVLAHLARLVACDTRNPPRSGGGIDALFLYATEELERAGFSVSVRDLGDGCRWLRARRHESPQALVNIHVDTVPADPGWTRDPHALLVDDDRAIGLGACDIKGALACFLVAAAATDGPGDLLLTTDEEAGSSRCVTTFVAENDVDELPVVVAEPTQARAVVAHRGIGTAAGTFFGTAGHASSPRALDDSAVHEAVRWAERALVVAASESSQTPGGLSGIRFNLGLFEGGLKANMIASKATLRFGVRPPPGTSPRDVVGLLCALARDPARVKWEPGYFAPALPAARPERSVDEARARGVALAKTLELPVGDDVDFFTEAALFSDAGATAIVFGPGDIAQAHSAEEWVSCEQLDACLQAYARLLGSSAKA